MAIETPQQPTSLNPEPSGVATRVALQLRQFICGLHGHDSLMHFERGRVSLLCSSCGYQTPGWEVKAAPTRRESNQSSGRVIKMPLVHERRVA